VVLARYRYHLDRKANVNADSVLWGEEKRKKKKKEKNLCPR